MEVCTFVILPTPSLPHVLRPLCSARENGRTSCASHAAHLRTGCCVSSAYVLDIAHSEVVVLRKSLHQLALVIMHERRVRHDEEARRRCTPQHFRNGAGACVSARNLPPCDTTLCAFKIHDVRSRANGKRNNPGRLGWWHHTPGVSNFVDVMAFGGSTTSLWPCWIHTCACGPSAVYTLSRNASDMAVCTSASKRVLPTVTSTAVDGMSEKVGGRALWCHTRLHTFPYHAPGQTMARVRRLRRAKHVRHA